ncbi:MAG: hypothetical protein WBN96_11585, partial [Gammaproteobacteria bacterium]
MNTLHDNVLARLMLAVSFSLLAACAGNSTQGTLASLKEVKLEIKEEKIEGSLEKALQSYQRFLEETPETAMTPEAIRRLADLKIEKEYSVSAPSNSVVIDVPDEAPEADVTPAASAAETSAEAKALPLPVDNTEPVTTAQSASMDTPAVPVVGSKQAAAITDSSKQQTSKQSASIADLSESEKAFSERATKQEKLKA